MLEWDHVRGEFYQDGSWRDIYVLFTTIEHWQSALDALRSSSFPDAVLSERVESPVPASAAEASPESGRADRLLSVDLHGPIANAHFFTETEIEFDVDPSQVFSQRELDAVLEFMQLLASATGREAILTPENQEHIQIFRVRPNDPHVEHTPFGGYQ